MNDPTPYLEAEEFWQILAPAIERIVRLGQKSDDGAHNPEQALEDIPEPRPFEM